MSYIKEQLLNRLNCIFFLFYIFYGTKNSPLNQQSLATTGNLIFLKILEQIFSCLSLFQTLDPYIETNTTTTDIYNIKIQYQVQ